MATEKDLIKMAVDAYKGVPAGNYSKEDVNEIIRQALIEANNGSEVINYRDMRDGKCSGLFSLIETLITKTVIEGLPDSSPIYKFVDFKNLADGDQNIFHIEDDGLFVVSEIAEGIQGIRRQRIGGGEDITVPVRLHAIKIYEEMRRVLAGRVTWTTLVQKVAESFEKQINTDIYNAVVAAFDDLQAPYSNGVAGSFNEDALVTMISHVEAATGMKAVIMGSKKALRKMTGVRGEDSEMAMEDLYKMGYYGRFYTTPVIELANGHVPGTTNFILNDDLYIVAGSDKFVKMVHEGDTLIIDRPSEWQDDLSQEYFMSQRYGIKVVLAANSLGVYKLS